MDSSDVPVLIGRLEREADERPQLYTAKVALVAALGFAPAALAALAALAAGGFLIASLIREGAPSFGSLSFFVIASVAVAGVVRAMRVEAVPAEGVAIVRENAPALFTLLDELLEKTAAPPLDAVILDAEYGVALVQTPRWGVFGGNRRRLRIGLPLLAALNAQEFAALAAHELGHLGGRSARFEGWIYRLRETWRNLGARLEEPTGVADQLLAILCGSYPAYFHAYSFALARSHEYAADRAAAAAAHPQILGRALVKRELIGRFLAEVFWERLFAQVEKAPAPPYRPYSVMQRAFKAAEKDWSRPEWLSDALRPYTAEADAHPSLAERLAALEVKPAAPGYGTQAPALSLLGPLAAQLIKDLDDAWLAEHAESWRKRHEELKEAHWKIAEYERYEDAELAPEDLWAKANLLLEVGRMEEGLGALETLTTRGAYPQAHLLLGQLLLQFGDENALEHLVCAAAQDPGLITTAGTIGYTYLVDRGRKPEAMRFWRRINPPAAA